MKNLLNTIWVTVASNRPQKNPNTVLNVKFSQPQSFGVVFDQKGPNMVLNGRFSQTYSQDTGQAPALGGDVYPL